MTITPRPKSLAQVAERCAAGESFEYELADFLHEFEREPNQAMVSQTPVLLCDLAANGIVFDAYLAAVAASLSARMQSPAPAWTRQAERILSEPWFASPGRHMRVLLLVESPAAFRERNLFVSSNALSVA